MDVSNLAIGGYSKAGYEQKNKTVLVCCQNNEEACIYFFMIIFVGINLHTLMGCYRDIDHII